jgi:hypothetical protein
MRAIPKTFAATVAIVLSGVLAGCGGSAPHHAAATTPSATTTPVALACSTTLASGSTAQSDISALVQDQKSQDSSEEQNWVNMVDGSLTSQGQDLQNAVTDFGPYTSGSQLASDASQFSSDASTFHKRPVRRSIPGLGAGVPLHPARHPRSRR